MIASSRLGSGVFVVALSHGTPVFQEVEVVRHPAAFATPAAIVFAKHIDSVLTTFGGSQCTVNTLLLGELVWLITTLNGEGTLKGGGDSESPAGTTASLVLDGSHMTRGCPVDSGGCGGKTSTTSIVSLALGKLDGLTLHTILETNPVRELFLVHVREQVMSESEGAGTLLISLAVLGVDGLVCLVEVELLFLVSSCRSNVLVVLGGVLVESPVLLQLIAVESAWASLSGSGCHSSDNHCLLHLFSFQSCF